MVQPLPQVSLLLHLPPALSTRLHNPAALPKPLPPSLPPALHLPSRHLTLMDFCMCEGPAVAPSAAVGAAAAATAALPAPASAPMRGGMMDLQGMEGHARESVRCLPLL